MHHKRRSRRRDKRVMASCGCCTIGWSGESNIKHPIEDGPCTGKNRSKRVKPKKERCPKNGKHEWYHETLVEYDEDVTAKSGYQFCADCDAIRYYVDSDGVRRWNWASWRDYCPAHKLVRKYHYNVKLSTCIHCWKTKTKNGERVYEDGKPQHRSWRRPLTFKKREVKLY